MKKALFGKAGFVLIFALVIGLPAAVAASQYTHIVVFGDSLSDNGNLYALDPTQVPDEDYYQGRLSNGPVWVEYLADADLLDADLDNRAYAGATTDGASPPGVKQQVSAYVADETALPDALYIIWIGANDFLGGSSDVQTSAANVGDALDELATFGANHIMVVDLPDLGATPRLNTDPQNAAIFTALTNGYNAELTKVVNTFSSANPSINVHKFRANKLFEDVIATPEDYGLSNADSVCPNFTIENDFDNDAGFLFWDAIHPTTEAHELIAERAAQALPDEDDDDDDSNGIGCFIGELQAAF